jgi:hypothetical protein
VPESLSLCISLLPPSEKKRAILLEQTPLRIPKFSAAATFSEQLFLSGSHFEILSGLAITWGQKAPQCSLNQKIRKMKPNLSTGSGFWLRTLRQYGCRKKKDAWIGLCTVQSRLVPSQMVLSLTLKAFQKD